MARARFSATDLPRLQRQLTTWRRSAPRTRRLPDEVWQAAAGLISTHGLSRVARALGLDYHKLRRCAGTATTPPVGERSSVPAGFVELPWPAATSAPSGLRVEWRDRHGATMTVHGPADTAALVALAEVFWRRP
jgi:hypothetical protein